ncbi:NAD(P)H-dependent oxidoreductase [Prolixibacter denitrificans]|uniref:Flavodoxin-like protein n=1 Tax=Prolixibacter denitrificans TaxID=1541063 RepID=A0A2P8CFS0_9BACT|nr:NAD(P)H-dependent oxidoreductase [Prolixibacter denitrificans]PSK83739.1 flavodoxin-like protein [Prolixibacter denitrificans]GET23284.1 hypothetical protein JCM18694_35300 [Prolixibacter denitrificans]
MKLAIINGSPRRKKSNSKILIERFLKGYYRECTDEVPVHYLAGQKRKEEALSLFEQAETVLVVFPLYTDCMPGMVKEFFEEVSKPGIIRPRRIGFIVQSGFPEAIHSVYVERYLAKFVKRLKREYLGTVIRGGVEGIQIMPPGMTRKLFSHFEELGRYFAEHDEFSPEIMEVLRKPYTLSGRRRMMFNLLKHTGLTNFYWNSHLKKNGAWEKRFDRPYENAQP